MSDIADRRLSRIIEGRAPSRRPRQVTPPHTQSLYATLLEIVLSACTWQRGLIFFALMCGSHFNPEFPLALMFGYNLVDWLIGEPRI
jgi:hypothetical protein